MSPFEYILAAMLFLQTPGQSIYSKVGVDPDAEPPCFNSYSLLCRPPRWSDAHNSHVVVETWSQGVVRYALIARVLSSVVFGEQWSVPKDKLWRYALTAIYSESGFRRDVHSGVGEEAKGDCKWTGPPGKRKRVKGSCKSWCLGQILLGSMGRTTITRADGVYDKGYFGKELVGLDEDATRRCLFTVVQYLDRSAQHCRKSGRTSVACVMIAYGGGNIEVDDPRLVARVKTYNKLLAAPTVLETQVRELLGIEYPEA